MYSFNKCLTIILHFRYFIPSYSKKARKILKKNLKDKVEQLITKLN